MYFPPREDRLIVWRKNRGTLRNDAVNAKAAVLIDGHTRQLAPLLIKPPSRLAPLFFLPRLLVIVLNLTPCRDGRRSLGSLAREKKTAGRQGDRSGGSADIYKIGLLQGFLCLVFLTTESLEHLAGNPFTLFRKNFEICNLYLNSDSSDRQCAIDRKRQVARIIDRA